MFAKKIPVVRVGQGGATGTPDEFDRYFERKRKSNRPVAREHQPKLEPIENRSMGDRIADFGLGES